MERIDWTELPATTREAIEVAAGPVTDAATAGAGVMSAFASTLTTPTGPVFAKGIRSDAPTAWVYRHEADVTAVAPLAPKVLWRVIAGGWDVYGYEYLTGRHNNLEPGSPDLSAVAQALTLLSEQPWPQQIGKKPLSFRLADFTRAEDLPLLQGTTLVHTDLGSFNQLATADGLRLLDWALSCPGPAWADTALMIPRLIAAGHSPAEALDLALQVPAYRDAASRTISVFAAAVHGFWEHRTAQEPLPHRVELVEAAKAWVHAVA